MPTDLDPAHGSNWGPVDDPIPYRDRPPTMSVYANPGDKWKIGIAYPVGYVTGRRGRIATFRLVVADEELEGPFICDCRLFVLLGEMARESNAPACSLTATMRSSALS